MSLGRNVKEFDIVYVEALRAAYPDATVDELSGYTYRSSSTVKRILDGGYHELRQQEAAPSDAVRRKPTAQLTLVQESDVMERLERLEAALGLKE